MGGGGKAAKKRKEGRIEREFASCSLGRLGADLHPSEKRWRMDEMRTYTYACRPRLSELERTQRQRLGVDESHERRVDLNSIFVSPSLGSRDRFKSSMRLDLYYKLGSTTSLLYLVLSNRELPTQRTKTSDQLDASDLELSSTSRSLSLSPIVDSLGP